MILTKELAKDLKDASRAVIWRDSKGQGAIKLIFESTLKGQKVEAEKWYLIDAALFSYEDNKSFGKDYTKYTEGSHPTCVCVLMWLDHNKDTAKTAFNFVNEGDEITLKFTGSTHNNIRELGFHHDELKLLVNRKGKRSLFLLEDSITPHNSARMIGGNDMSVCNAPNFDVTDSKFTNRVLDRQGAEV